MWNYRVILRGATYAIHEVYYREDGSIKGATKEPVFPVGESVKELEEEISHYAKALELPFLNYEEIVGKAEDDELHPYSDQQVILADGE